MYSHYRSKVKLEGKTNSKRFILIGIVILFGSAAVFASGFYAGIKFQSKKEGILLKEKDALAVNDYSSANKTDERPKLDEAGPKTEERKNGTEAQKSNIPKSTQKDAGDLKSKDDNLTFYQTLVSKKKQDTVDLDQKQNPALKTEKPNPSQEKDKTKVKNSSVKDENQNKTYTVQVGAYKEKEVAETVMNKLKKKGYSAHVMVKEIPNEGTIYKVRIGEFPNRERAEEHARMIKVKEKMSAFVTLK
jgi:cell division septation protein DedD